VPKRTILDLPAEVISQAAILWHRRRLGARGSLRAPTSGDTLVVAIGRAALGIVVPIVNTRLEWAPAGPMFHVIFYHPGTATEGGDFFSGLSLCFGWIRIWSFQSPVFEWTQHRRGEILSAA